MAQTEIYKRISAIGKPHPVILVGITYRSVSDLKLDPRNPRRHKQKQIRKIAASIQGFGFIVPVLVDKDGNVIAGHGRVLAAKLLGLSDIPTICIEQLTEAQIRAFVIADNRLAEHATWDDRLLGEQLKALSEVDLDFSLEITGFEIPEIDFYIQGLGGSSQAAQDPDDVLPDPGPAVTHPSDRWQLGRHFLYCGDARNDSSYAALLEGKKAAMVFADVPFNVKVSGHVSGLGAIQHREFAMASGEMTPAEFIAFLTQVFRLLAAYSVEGALHFICMDWAHIYELLSASRTIYSEYKNMCVWAKDNAGMGSLYRSQHELIFVFKNGKDAHRNNIQLGKYGRYRSNVWRYPGMNSFSRSTEEGNLLALHPTVKPVALCADAILDVTARGDIVLDSFCGSGTTLMAAERVGRTCYAMEIDPRYCDTILRRYIAYTGEQPRHHASGKTFAQIARQRAKRGPIMAKRKALKSPSTHAVGYGKPPRASQFKKGVSGNPKGRPKGSPNLVTVLGRTLRERVTVTENGRQYVITKCEAAMKQLVNKAASGDARALQLLLRVQGVIEDQPVASAPQPVAPAVDPQIIESIVRRIRRSESEES